jgi:hypothetical protein
MIAATTFTPPGLTFAPETHAYTLQGQRLLSVTGVLRQAGLVDVAFFTPDDRERGTRVHAAIERYHAPTRLVDVTRFDPFDGDEVTGPYLRAYRRFLAESAFRVDACEERLGDLRMMLAGTLDLRGQFIDARLLVNDRIDVIDVKTGSMPPWVGVQLAGYVCLLPPGIRPRVRRWCLALRQDGSYRLAPCVTTTDTAVFTAALLIAQFRQGWL